MAAQNGKSSEDITTFFLNLNMHVISGLFLNLNMHVFSGQFKRC